MATYSTDLGDFLTETGAFPANIPVEARQFAEFLGSVVAAVTNDAYTNFPETAISCIQQKKRKVCGGVIHAGFGGELTNPEIGWHCSKCGSSGVIRGWEGTVWDMVGNFFGEETVH